MVFIFYDEMMGIAQMIFSCLLLLATQKSVVSCGARDEELAIAAEEGDAAEVRVRLLLRHGLDIYTVYLTDFHEHCE